MNPHDFTSSVYQLIVLPNTGLQICRGFTVEDLQGHQLGGQVIGR